MGPILERLTPTAGVTLNNSSSDVYYSKIDGRKNFRVYAVYAETAGGTPTVDTKLQVLPSISTGGSRYSPAWPATTGADTAMVFPDGGLHDPSAATSGVLAVFVNTPVSEIAVQVTNDTSEDCLVHVFVEKI
jgi:hypothetical protein